MDDYLIKPVRLDDLRAALERRSQSGAPLESDISPIAKALGQPRPGEPDSAAAPLAADTLATMRALFGPGGADKLAAMIDDYLNDAAELLAIMRSAVEQAQEPMARGAAHKLKSSSLLIGAVALSRLCDELELMVSAQASDGWREQVQAIEAEFARVKIALERERLA